MAKDKKKSKGPEHRNSNYQLKNGNKSSKKQDKKSVLSGISNSISSAANGFAKMLKKS